MLGSTYTDLRRGNVLVKALLTHEITQREFQEETEFLEPEAARVLATVLANSNDLDDSNSTARAVCLRVASRFSNRN
jgi:hypothetical protein